MGDWGFLWEVNIGHMELISNDGINLAARVTGGVLLKRDCNCWIICAVLRDACQFDICEIIDWWIFDHGIEYKLGLAWQENRRVMFFGNWLQ